MNIRKGSKSREKHPYKCAVGDGDLVSCVRG